MEYFLRSLEIIHLTINDFWLSAMQQALLMDKHSWCEQNKVPAMELQYNIEKTDYKQIRK